MYYYIIFKVYFSRLLMQMSDFYCEKKYFIYEIYIKQIVKYNAI